MFQLKPMSRSALIAIRLFCLLWCTTLALFSYTNSYADEKNTTTNAAAKAPIKKAKTNPKKPLNWWQKRHKRADIYFPHNAHMSVMQKRGDLCMACHPFTGTPKTSIQQQQKLTHLSNEPLEAICHECHVVERSAPLDCKVCHTDISKIRPKDHGLNYNDFHGATAKRNEAKCRTCHIEMSFCTNCHFRHNNSQRIKHPLGYRDRHGLDARLDASACGRCHNASYCRNCHQGKGR